MFAALRCQGPEELTICRACCGHNALHPEEWKAMCQGKWSDLFINWFLNQYDAAWIYAIVNPYCYILPWFYSTHVYGDLFFNPSEELLGYNSSFLFFRIQQALIQDWHDYICRWPTLANSSGAVPVARPVQTCWIWVPTLGNLQHAHRNGPGWLRGKSWQNGVRKKGSWNAVIYHDSLWPCRYFFKPDYQHVSMKTSSRIRHLGFQEYSNVRR